MKINFNRVKEFYKIEISVEINFNHIYGLIFP